MNNSDIMNQDWFKEYLANWGQMLEDDIPDNWENVAEMTTAEILQLIADCGNTGSSTALNGPLDSRTWEVAARAANKIAILAFYLEMRYLAIGENVKMVVGEIEDEDETSVDGSDSANGPESEPTSDDGKVVEFGSDTRDASRSIRRPAEAPEGKPQGVTDGPGIPEPPSAN